MSIESGDLNIHLSDMQRAAVKHALSLRREADDILRSVKQDVQRVFGCVDGEVGFSILDVESGLAKLEVIHAHQGAKEGPTALTDQRDEDLQFRREEAIERLGA